MSKSFLGRNNVASFMSTLMSPSYVEFHLLSLGALNGDCATRDAYLNLRQSVCVFGEEATRKGRQSQFGPQRCPFRVTEVEF